MISSQRLGVNEPVTKITDPRTFRVILDSDETVKEDQTYTFGFKPQGVHVFNQSGGRLS